jgi:hypothetical protein
MMYSTFTAPKKWPVKLRSRGEGGSSPSNAKTTEKQNGSNGSHPSSSWKFAMPKESNKLLAILNFRIPRYRKHQNDPEKGKQTVVIESKEKEAKK